MLGASEEAEAGGKKGMGRATPGRDEAQTQCSTAAQEKAAGRQGVEGGRSK